MSSYLLDTCATIWIANDEPLSQSAFDQLSSDFDGRIFVSPITAWEVAQLVAKGKLALSINPQVWFKKLFDSPDIVQAELSASVLISSTMLPDITIADPADRILIATAREFGFTLVTRDHDILKYGQLGHVKVLQC